jgi:hypothetical protein
MLLKVTMGEEKMFLKWLPKLLIKQISTQQEIEKLEREISEPCGYSGLTRVAGQSTRI